MFWLWIILATIWGGCSGAVLAITILEDEWENEKLAGKILLGFIVLLAPLVFMGMAIGEFLDTYEGGKVDRFIKRIWRSIRKPFLWIINYRQRQKDHKEMDEKEDEWKIERLGIKLK